MKWHEDLRRLRTNLLLPLDSFPVLRRNQGWAAVVPEPAHVVCHGLGSFPLPLGALVELWTVGGFTATCPTCQGTLYIVSAAADLKTRWHSLLGLCERCPEPQATVFDNPHRMILLRDARYEAHLRNEQRRRRRE